MAASAASASGRHGTRFRGLLRRTLSAVILGPLLLAALWLGFPWIDLVAAVATPIMISEWVGLTRGRPIARSLAVLYTLAAVVAFLWLRHQPMHGRDTAIWIVACVWATDIGAYILGTIAGGAKLAPSISPNKTWSGLLGGVAAAAVVSAAAGLAVQRGSTLELAVAGMVIAVVAQLGDLLESAAKRRAGVKDSGRLIPGHGGLLDRLDGLLAALVTVALGRLVAGEGAWPWT